MAAIPSWRLASQAWWMALKLISPMTAMMMMAARTASGR
jgi:hypothetical protein